MTLVHGDFWSNNLMLKLGRDLSVADMSIIDFQECMISRPTVDLGCFFSTRYYKVFRVHC